MARPALTNGLLTAALVACGLLVAALVYGLATRTLTPRTTPVRGEAQAASDSTAEAERAAAANRITVTVLNGTAINGLAAQTRELLRRRGFDVQEVGTARAADSTTVEARNGTRDDALRVAAALGLPERRVADGRAPDENATTVAVTLGPDYAQFRPFQALP